VTATRSQVESWRPSDLRSAASTLRTTNDEFRDRLDRVVSTMTESSEYWSGRAYDAALDRAHDERTGGTRVADAVHSVAEALERAEASLSSQRTVVIARVNDAHAQGFEVTDDWRVLVTVYGSAEDLAARTDRAAVLQSMLGDAVNALTEEDRRVHDAIVDAVSCLRDIGDRVGMGSGAADGPTSRDAEEGNRDGNALADDPERKVLERVAADLRGLGLDQASLDRMLRGEPISTLPQATQDYYRELYRAAGKDGILALADHLRDRESGGDPAAAASLDTLANGLMVISNEKVGTDLAADGTLIGAGGYDHVPDSFRDLLSSRPRVGDDPFSTETDPDYISDLSKFGSLVREANPAFAPGTQFGTELYQKAGDMMLTPVDAMRYSQSEDLSAYDWAAASFADAAGRNHDAANAILTGDGMHEGYDPAYTVSSLVRHDWSATDGGLGAASLFQWIADDSAYPAGDPDGEQARRALTYLPELLAPTDAAPDYNTEGGRRFAEEGGRDVFDIHREGFARSPELASALSRALSANMDAIDPAGSPDGWTGSTRYLAGGPLLNVTDSNHLLELASLSAEGRSTLTATVTQRANDDLAALFAEDAADGRPGDLSRALTQVSDGLFAGRLERQMVNAVTYTDQLGVTEYNDSAAAIYQAKTIGIKVAGDMLLAPAAGLGAVPGDGVKSAGQSLLDLTVKSYLDQPEYRTVQMPDEYQMAANERTEVTDRLIKAAYQSGTLDPRLMPEGIPLNAKDIEHNTVAADALQQMIMDRGLSEYVNRYVTDQRVAYDSEAPR